MAKVNGALDLLQQGQKIATYAAKANATNTVIDAQASKILQTKLDNFKTVADIITKPFRKIGSVLFNGNNPIAHYVALLIVILFIAGGISFFILSPKKPNLSALLSNPFNIITRTFSKILPGYRSRLMAKSMTPYSGVIPSTPREKILGRCDNITMREVSGGKGGGLCERTVVPNDIRWIINPETIPELEEIPSLIKSKIAGENGEKYTVSIPWKIYPGGDGMNYYPDCSQAKFSDGTDASKLFIDNGTTSCTKRVVSRTQHSEAYRPISLEGNTNYKGLNSYASENNPMC
jgi:hypothetical protein